MKIPFSPKESTSLAVTTTSGNVSLGAYVGTGQTRPQVRLYNKGAADIFIAFGGNSVTALTSDMILPAGALEVLSLDEGALQRYIAAITLSGTATLYITTGGGI